MAATRLETLQGERSQIMGQIDATLRVAEARAGAGGSANLTDDEQAAVTAAEVSLATTEANIAQEQRLTEARRKMPSTPVEQGAGAARTSGYHTRAEDKPWGFEYGVERLQASFSPRDQQLARDVATGDHAKAVYRASLNQYDTDPRLLNPPGGGPQASTGMNETTPADGGFLVQTDQRSEMLERTYAMGQISSRLTRDTVGPNANGIAVPMLNETSRADGSRWGGLRGYWTGEGAGYTASRPTYDKFRLDLDKITALVVATDEMLSDVPMLGGWLNRMAPLELNFKLEDGVVNGTGVGMPLGLLAAANLAKVTVSKETGQAADTIVMANIVKMFSRLWPSSMTRAVWLVNQNIIPSLFQLTINVGTGGVPVYLPPNGLADRPFSTLFGLPVIPAEYMPTLGDEGDITLVDLSQYALIEKGGIRSDSSIHVYFTTGEQAFRYTYRVNGAPWWKTALTPKNGTDTISPFVTLAAR